MIRSPQQLAITEDSFKPSSATEKQQPKAVFRPDNDDWRIYGNH
jgi:hypothetical protein